MWKPGKDRQQELDENLTRLQEEKVNVFQLFGYVPDKHWKQINSFYILVEWNPNSYSNYCECEQTSLLFSNVSREWCALSTAVLCN